MLCTLLVVSVAILQNKSIKILLTPLILQEYSGNINVRFALLGIKFDDCCVVCYMLWSVITWVFCVTCCDFYCVTCRVD
jgi:hypothetical protein